MPDLLIIVPTRGRPEAAAELLTVWDGANADLLFAVDDDDPDRDTYAALDAWVTVGPRRRLGPTLNAAAAEYAGDYRAVGFLGDDHRPRTPGWPEQFLEALDRHPVPGLAYGNDLLQGRNLPTAVVMDSRIIGALGRMVPEGLVHLFLDNYWLDLGRELDAIAYLDNVIVEHLHPVAGKAEWTPAYQESNAWWAHDEATYRAFVAAGGIQADAALIRAAS